MALRQDVGALWENYLIGERIKRANNSRELVNFYFWRTYNGQEVDLIEEQNGELRAFEFKWGNRSAKAPSAFVENYPTASYLVVNQSNYLDFVM